MSAPLLELRLALRALGEAVWNVYRPPLEKAVAALQRLLERMNRGLS